MKLSNNFIVNLIIIIFGRNFFKKQSIMTRFVKSSLLILSIGFIVLSSCKKEELEDTNLANPTPPVSDIGKMSCFTKSAQWEASTYHATVFNDVLNFYGINENNDTIEINVLLTGNSKYYEFFQSGINYGAYTNRSVDTIGYYSTLYFDPTTAKDVGDPAGKVNFSDLDITNSLISGTFAFRVSKDGQNNQVPITEGKFTNLKLSEDTTYNNTLTATVNSTDEAVGTYVTAKKDLSTNTMEIVGNYPISKYISVTFDATSLSAGDTLSMNSSNYGIYFDGGQMITSHNGSIIIVTYDDVAKKIKIKFNFSYNGTTVESGVSDCMYLEY